MMPEILKINQQWGVYSWTTGFTPSKITHKQISRVNLEAKINRLMNKEQWEEAEELLELF
jgi:hypothetical protein